MMILITNTLNQSILFSRSHFVQEKVILLIQRNRNAEQTFNHTHTHTPMNKHLNVLFCVNLPTWEKN